MLRYVLYCCVFLSMPLPAAAATVMVFGDSISAGYGLPPGQGWVAQLEKVLAPRHRVINASLSGETTAGGVTRLPQALARHHPDWVVLELGGNDGLRGLPLADMRSNLQRMLVLCRQAHAKVLLVGLSLPPNYGAPYGQAFHKIYDELAARQHLAYIPQLMAGFSGDLTQFQPDGIHPAAAAQAIMLHTIRSKLPL
jgi:acyl-CoA thioesterase-1